MRTLLVLALLLACVPAADAADRWGRSSYGRSTYNSSGGFNSYGTRSYGQRSFFIPQENTVIIQQDLGYGQSVFQSAPMVQYGVDAPVYVPQQRAYNRPSWAR